MFNFNDRDFIFSILDAAGWVNPRPSNLPPPQRLQALDEPPAKAPVENNGTTIYIGTVNNYYGSPPPSRSRSR